MVAQTALDQAKLEAFDGKALGDLAGTMASFMCAIGDLCWPKSTSAYRISAGRSLTGSSTASFEAEEIVTYPGRTVRQYWS